MARIGPYYHRRHPPGVLTGAEDVSKINSKAVLKIQRKLNRLMLY